MARRVLVTGVASFWGGRAARALENDPSVDVIVGLDTSDPTVELQRTELVRTDQTYSTLARIVRAVQVDTVVHTSLVVDSTRMSGRALHEINVIGTMNLLAAAGAPDSPVRQVVVKSSSLVYGSSHRDPNCFREDMSRSTQAKTRVECSLLEVESYLRDFAGDNPDVSVAVLRLADIVGTDIVTPISKALSLPAVPTIFGFDPLVQFCEEDDVVRAIDFAVQANLSGTYNVAGDGRLPWSEVTTIVGKRPLFLPPVLTGLSTAALTRLGVYELPAELIDLLRYGRGVDTGRFKRAGFEFGHTTAGAVGSFVRGQRRSKSVGQVRAEPRYDLESFFRQSPAVVRPEPA